MGYCTIWDSLVGLAITLEVKASMDLNGKTKPDPEMSSSTIVHDQVDHLSNYYYFEAHCSPCLIYWLGTILVKRAKNAFGLSHRLTSSIISALTSCLLKAHPNRRIFRTPLCSRNTCRPVVTQEYGDFIWPSRFEYDGHIGDYGF